MAAQQEAVVEQIASVLAAEDARNFQQPVIAGAVVSPDSVVRRLAVLGAGRIGDRRATPLVLPLLTDPDSTVRVAAAFALGLLRDPAGARPLMDRITGSPALDTPDAESDRVTITDKTRGYYRGHKQRQERQGVVDADRRMADPERDRQQPEWGESRASNG